MDGSNDAMDGWVGELLRSGVGVGGPTSEPKVALALYHGAPEHRGAHHGGHRHPGGLECVLGVLLHVLAPFLHPPVWCVGVEG